MKKAKTYILLWVFYVGNSVLLNNYVCYGSNLQKLISLAKHRHKGRDVQVYLPGQEMPDDGGCFDTRIRYRIIEAKPYDVLATEY